MGWLLLAFLAAGAARPYWHWLVRLRAAAAAGHPLRLVDFFGGIGLLWALPVLDGAPRPPDLKTLRRFPLAPASALGCRAVGIALQATTWLALALLLPFAFTAGRAWKAARDLAGLAAFSLVCVSAWSALSTAAGSTSTTPTARPSFFRGRARSLFLLQLCQFGRYLDLWLTFLLLLPLAGYLAQESASPVAYLFGLGAASALLGSLALNQFGADTPATLLRYRSFPCGAAGLLRASNLAWLALLLVATLPLHLAALRWRGLVTVGLGLLVQASSAGAYMIVGNYSSIHSPRPLRRCVLLSGGPVALSLAALLAGAIAPVLGILTLQHRLAPAWLLATLIITGLIYRLRLRIDAQSLGASNPSSRILATSALMDD